MILKKKYDIVENKMKITELVDLWKKDSTLDATDLVNESIRIWSLHSKYLGWLSEERKVLKQLEHDLARMIVEKNTYYSEGPSNEEWKRDRNVPASGRILVKDVPLYVNADADIQRIQLQHEASKIKVDHLTKIVDILKNRSYTINELMKYEMFRNGAN